MYIYNLGKVEILSSAFMHNRADLNGGAVMVKQGSSITLKASSFIDNRAGLNGGAVMAQGSVELTASPWGANLFTRNTAGQRCK